MMLDPGEPALYRRLWGGAAMAARMAHLAAARGLDSAGAPRGLGPLMTEIPVVTGRLHIRDPCMMSRP